MKFFSTKDTSTAVSLREAVLGNMPNDGGLYMPVAIPKVHKGFLDAIASLSYAEAAFEILKVLIEDELPADALEKLCYRAFTFDAPLVSLNENIHTLELFHGPTLAFKDFGVRWMAELLGYYRGERSKPLTILTATSGDTGGAVASAFHNKPGFEIFILYPSGKVSDVQEQQIAGLGGNVTAIEVRGTFDDCQRLVKQALVDQTILSRRSFCSANSINVSRLLPQVCYYFRAYSQLKVENSPLIFSVPSGNFGNLAACLIAKKMGLPVHHAVAATNSNDVVPRYLKSSSYEVHPFKETLSNAMDIADPSNFVRIMALYNNSLADLRKTVSAYAFTDSETKEGISELAKRFNYVGEPHGAIGYLGLKAALKEYPDATGVFLGTAHPSKFGEQVIQFEKKNTIQIEPAYPALSRILA